MHKIIDGGVRAPQPGNPDVCETLESYLAFTRYCFTSKLYCESLSSFYPPPTCKAYPIAILLHDHCAIYAPPLTPLLYAIHHTALVMAISCSKGFALTWYRALTWHSSPARPFAAPDDPRLVTGQQGSLSPACQQLSRARTVYAGGSSEGSTN